MKVSDEWRQVLPWCGVLAGVACGVLLSIYWRVVLVYAVAAVWWVTEKIGF